MLSPAPGYTTHNTQVPGVTCLAHWVVGGTQKERVGNCVTGKDFTNPFYP